MLYCIRHRPIDLPERPPTSIFLRFLASKMTMVSFPAVGTYRSEKHTSPSSDLPCEQREDDDARKFSSVFLNPTETTTTIYPIHLTHCSDVTRKRSQRT